jgi:hypothetical protein
MVAFLYSSSELHINWWKLPTEIQEGIIYFVSSMLNTFLPFLYPFVPLSHLEILAT